MACSCCHTGHTGLRNMQDNSMQFSVLYRQQDMLSIENCRNHVMRCASLCMQDFYCGLLVVKRAVLLCQF